MSWLSLSTTLKKVREHSLDANQILAWKKRLKYVSLIIGILFIAVHIIVRFFLWPQVESHKATFEQLVSQNIGAQLKIEEIKTDWNFLWPSFKIKNIAIYDSTEKSSKPRLTIPELTGNVSWESIWTLQPHFHDLNFNDATIYAHRSQDGNWDIGGIKLDKKSAGYKSANWLFEQDSLNINDAKIIWLDQLHQSAEYQIDIQSLILNNTWYKHRLELATKTPWNKDLAKITAKFRHNVLGNAGNWQDWNGRVDWQISDVNLQKINQLFDSPVKILDGKFSSEGYVYLDSGSLDGGKTTIQASQLHFEWNRIAKPLKIYSINSEIEQDTQGKKMSLSATSLKWQIDKTSKATELNDISVYWEKANDIDSIKYAGIKASEIDLALVEQLAGQFPLPKDISTFIKNYQPEGQLEDLDASWNADTSQLPFDISLPGFNKSHYKLAFKFSKLYLKPEKKDFLAISNLNGKIYATELGGEVSIAGKNTSFVLPGILENDHLDLVRADGLIEWTKNQESFKYVAKNMRLENSDASVNFDAEYRPSTKKAPEFLSIKGNIDRAEVNKITRYFPLGMSKDARAYVRGALKSGLISNGTLNISGNPEHIPFDTKHPGIFDLHLPIKNVQYSPAPNEPKKQGQWADFTNVTGVVSFKGPQLQVDFNHAVFESVNLKDIHGSISNIVSTNAVLKINGEASGSSEDLLKYYIQSPPGLKLQKTAEQINLTGNGKLKINIELPLANTAKTTIQGSVYLDKNQATINKTIEVKEIYGEILFSEDNVLGKNLKANLLGGNITFESGSKLPWKNADGMKVHGQVKINQLIDVLNTNSDEQVKTLQQQLDGLAAYDGSLSITSSGYKLDLGLQLKDMSSNFPTPFNKKLGEGLTGKLTLNNTKETNSETVGQLKISKLIDANFVFKDKSDLRLGIGINTPGYVPSKGITSTIVFENLDTSVWQNWLSKNFPESTSTAKNQTQKKAALQLNAISAYIKNLRVADRDLKDVSILATHDEDLWHASINSPLATGLVQWRSATPGLPQGKLTARLQKLTIENSSSGETITKSINQRIQKIPALDIQSDLFVLNGQPYGKIELLANNDKNDWKIEKLSLKTEDAEVKITGRWILPKQGKKLDSGRTELNFDLDIDNAGKLLSKLGFPKAIDDGSGKLVGQLNWADAPYKYDLQTLQADLSLDIVKGTILQVDPGLGRLLGVLSFQGLTRIATLDIGGVLKPIVTQGTPFDRITSRGTIANGVANIKDLNMKGPQGNVRLTGHANLLNETQDMRITVSPNFNAGTASLGYTFINPIIGLSTLVGQYLIADEVSKLFQLDYLVQGTWATPQIIALDNKGNPLDEKQLKEIRDKSLLRQQQSPNKK
jgi:uncharacterized protein (TIGR02099 family)